MKVVKLCFRAGKTFGRLFIGNLKGMIAIEFDGPYHYLSGGTGRNQNGKTKMKARMLTNLGWRVVNIPWYEWAEVNKGLSWKPKQIEYLKSMLSQVEGKVFVMKKTRV